MVLKLLIREGPFYKGNMHGVGYLTSISSADRDEVLMRHNELVCQLKGDKLAFNYLLDTVSTYVSFRFLLELSPGTQVEIQDAQLGVPMWSRATILNQIKGWKHLVRFQDELNPRQRPVRHIYFLFQFVSRMTLCYLLPSIGGLFLCETLQDIAPSRQSV